MIEKPAKYWTGDYWSESAKPIREENLDFSLSFTKDDYENLVRMADEILTELKNKKMLRLTDIICILAYRKCPFCSAATKCVFTLVIRKAISKGHMVAFYPIINLLKTPDVVVTDFEFRFVEIQQLGPLNTVHRCE